MAIEGMSLTDAVYFTVVTISTVGYGDISPHTPWGKLLAMLLIFTGAGTFVSLIALGTDAFLDRRERNARRAKLHMLIGLFFSEIGSRLLAFLAQADPKADRLTPSLCITPDWGEEEFAAAGLALHRHPHDIDAGRADLAGLDAFLLESKGLVVRLLESPYVLEHNRFADLQIALLHLKEELNTRPRLTDLPERDLDHLGVDLQRVYRLLTRQWLEYLQELQTQYPFLYSLAVRTNPFNPQADPVVR